MAERRSARMSKITTNVLTRSGTGRMATVGVNGLTRTDKLMVWSA